MIFFLCSTKVYAYNIWSPNSVLKCFSVQLYFLNPRLTYFVLNSGRKIPPTYTSCERARDFVFVVSTYITIIKLIILCVNLEPNIVLMARINSTVHPRTGHDAPDGEERYSSTLPLTWSLDGMSGQLHF
jgi:hypothetical protein